MKIPEICLACEYFCQHYALWQDKWTMIHKLDSGHCIKNLRSNLKPNCENYKFSKKVANNADRFNICVEIRNKIIDVEKILEEVYLKANIIR